MWWCTSSCTARTRFAGESPTIAAPEPELTGADRAALLGLARRAIEAALAGLAPPELPDVPGAALHRGAFVTLEERGALRGCVGQVAADRPLAETIRRVAVSAAREDPRFRPVVPHELPQLRIEISVLHPPVRADPVDPRRVAIGRDGLLVRRGQSQAVLLPQVAREHGLGPEAFLSAACMKAGLPAESWWEPGGATQVYTFSADVFGE